MPSEGAPTPTEVTTPSPTEQPTVAPSTAAPTAAPTFAPTASTVATTPFPFARCPDNTSWYLDSDTGCCYRLFDAPRLMYADAAASCLAQFGGSAQLASIQSVEQATFIARLQDDQLGNTDNTPRWVNGVYNQTTGFFTGSSISALGLFYPGEPIFRDPVSGASLDHYCLQQGTTSRQITQAHGIVRFDNSDCTNRRRYVCEFCPATAAPSAIPTVQPSAVPTSPPSAAPTRVPTTSPTAAPSAPQAHSRSCAPGRRAWAAPERCS